ncbi:MAG TPA: ATP-binding protein [Arachidicoccus sp.]|nr:ATP-binding protein [Arachidicoccus sp.]
MKKHKFYFISFTYWFLLLYIISALVWWFISLEAQNRQMFTYRYEQLRSDDYQYTQKIEALEDARYRKSLQYIGEGLTFFVLIMIGAAYVYRTIRQEIKSADQQQNFMMAITHEFKTPIAITRLNLETLQKRRLEPEQQQKLILNTLSETQRLNSLTNNILTTAQLESRHHAISEQEIDLSELIRAGVEEFRVRYPLRAFHLRIEPDIWIKGEQLLLQLLISNLMDNAIKYDPERQPIVISLTQIKQRTVRLEIKDQGPGIPQEDKKRIFTKFYRVGSESVRTTKGTGLGLYLCKRIVSDHSGQISVTDNQPNGAIFTIQFPILNLKK